MARHRQGTSTENSTMASATAILHDTTDPDEVAKFADLGTGWWDTAGPMAPLHKLNPVRIAYIRDRACERFGRDPVRAASLAGLTALDIGCGGGLLAEPLTRLSAAVCGIDPIEANVEIARWHAQEVGLEIDYRASTVEAVAAAGRQFDLVVASEVIEHVPD